MSQGSVDDERMDNERVQRQSLSLEVTQGAQAMKSVKTGLFGSKTKSSLRLNLLGLEVFYICRFVQKGLPETQLKPL